MPKPLVNRLQIAKYYLSHHDRMGFLPPNSVDLDGLIISGIMHPCTSGNLVARVLLFRMHDIMQEASTEARGCWSKNWLSKETRGAMAVARESLRVKSRHV